MRDAPSPVPEVIGRYLSAHDRRDTGGALATFTSDARVHHDGHDHVGPVEIRDRLVLHGELIAELLIAP